MKKERDCKHVLLLVCSHCTIKQAVINDVLLMVNKFVVLFPHLIHNYAELALCNWLIILVLQIILIVGQAILCVTPSVPNEESTIPFRDIPN